MAESYHTIAELECLISSSRLVYLIFNTRRTSTIISRIRGKKILRASFSYYMALITLSYIYLSKYPELFKVYSFITSYTLIESA
jgi:hypothetical protein